MNSTRPNRSKNNQSLSLTVNTASVFKSVIVICSLVLFKRTESEAVILATLSISSPIKI